MLLCYEHHRLVDKQDPEGHPRERLLGMKQAQEKRVSLACGIPPENKSHVLIYGANIGDHKTALDYRTTASALLPQRRYPANREPFLIQTRDDSRTDRNPEYWGQERQNLETKFATRILPVIAAGDDPHISVFGLAPQPLLVLLGALLSDKYNVAVYQRHREPVPGWAWPDLDDDYETLTLQLARPESFNRPPALVLSLSATLTENRVLTAMGDDCAIWHVSIPVRNQHCIRSPHDLVVWRRFIMRLLGEIKEKHGHGTELHIFPAVPVSAAVTLGLVRQSKADMPFHVYDEVPGRGFVQALTIG
ncbi:MAG: SAVED domain-containing protein [Ardenticatenia bacterium]|nr:SAVED domain-containing protein [Ardenticatenia bacterium]